MSKQLHEPSHTERDLVTEMHSLVWGLVWLGAGWSLTLWKEWSQGQDHLQSFVGDKNRLGKGD